MMHTLTSTMTVRLLRYFTDVPLRKIIVILLSFITVIAFFTFILRVSAFFMLLLPCKLLCLFVFLSIYFLFNLLHDCLLLLLKSLYLLRRLLRIKYLFLKLFLHFWLYQRSVCVSKNYISHSWLSSCIVLR